MSLIDELKRRNVFKVAGAYLALGWVVVQATATLTPAFHLPESTLPLVTWVGVIGFPFVVAFSWIYELTPEGLKREREVDRSQSITHRTSKRLDYVIIGMLGLAMLLFAADRFLPRAADEDAGRAAARRDPTDSAALAPNDKSIAVLPFVNMSPDKDQEYFSDGMSEELLNLLAKAPDLKVIARTSSFAFKGKDVPIAEISRQLNVAHVLEGSVRKSGNTVRITAQLIRAADSTHLWSETYDRALDDIFAVQDEIANAIVQALQIGLAGGTLSRREGGTQNLEAYQLYLQAVSAFNQNTRSSLKTAHEYLDQATKTDANYGIAWSKMAETVILETDSGWIVPTQGYERARELDQHALQLSPSNAHAHAMLQYVHRTLDWDWAAAEIEGQLAFRIDPTNPDVMSFAANFSRTLGHWDAAEREFQAALDRDPLNTVSIWELGTTYYHAGRFAEAERTYLKVLRLAPQFTWARALLGSTLLAQGRDEEALRLVEQEADEGWRLYLLPIVLQAVGRQSEADEALRAQIDRWSDRAPYWVARTYAYRGEHDLALEWLDRAYLQKDNVLPEILGEPLFKSVAGDPRFNAFLQKMNLPTEPVPVNWQ